MFAAIATMLSKCDYIQEVFFCTWTVHPKFKPVSLVIKANNKDFFAWLCWNDDGFLSWIKTVFSGPIRRPEVIKINRKVFCVIYYPDSVSR